MSAVPSYADAFRTARPLYEEAAAAVGPADAVRCVELVMTWRWLRSYYGRDPLARDHYDALGISQATYYRRLALVRRAYGVQHISEVTTAPAAAMPSLSTALQVGLT